MAVKISNYYQTDFDNQVERAKEVADVQKKNINKTYDTQIEKLTADAQKQTVAAENSYDAAYADNAVQRAINERQIKTSMANAGIQDSGLNRTQMTAVELQKANADNQVSMQKNSFINKIKSTLQESIYTSEQSRTSELNAVDTQLLSDTNSIYNQMDTEKRAKLEEITSNIASITDPTTAAGYIKTVSKQYGIDAEILAAYSPVVTKNTYKKYLENEKYFTNKANYKELHSTLAGIDTTAAAGQTVAAKQIMSYANTNNATKSQIKKLCETAGISYSDYTKFLKDGQLFEKREEAKQAAKAAATVASKVDDTGYKTVSSGIGSILSRNKNVSGDKLIKLVGEYVYDNMGSYNESDITRALSNNGLDTEDVWNYVYDNYIIEPSDIKTYTDAVRYIKNHGGSVKIMTEDVFSRNPYVNTMTYVEYLQSECQKIKK